MATRFVGRFSSFERLQHNALSQAGSILTMCQPCLSAGQSKRPYSESVVEMKRGRGGRSSFSGIVSTVFGASGFFGHSLVNKLGKIGSQIIIPYRGDPYDVRDLKLMGDLGQILFMPYHLEDEDSIRKAVQHSNFVINLVGRSHETSNFSFEKVHVDGAARIARIAKEMGVEKFIHVSALNATANPTPFILPNGSRLLKSKMAGEAAVRQEFPEAVIFRPADMWGQMDHFIFYYCSKYRRFRVDESMVTIPLWKKGVETVKQPVYSGDVALGIIKAIEDRECVAQVYDAVGPNRYRLDELVRWFYTSLRFQPSQFKISDIYFWFKWKVRMNERIQPIATPVSLERVESEFPTDKLSGNPTLEDLGVSLTPLEDRLHWELKPFRKYGYYWDALGEFPTPPNPPLAEDDPYAVKM